MATAAQKQAAKLRAEAAAKAAAEGKPTSEQINALNREATIHPDRVPSAHGEQLKAGSAGAKCFVGFKVGIPWLEIQLSELVDKDEQTQTGVRRIKEAVRIGPVVRIRGTAYPRGTPPEGFPEKPMIVSGCAITPNVDRDFMRRWLELNRESAMVINQMIFMADTEQDAIAKARELAGELSGFDPILPPLKDGKMRDPRMPRPANKAVGDLEPGKA